MGKLLSLLARDDSNCCTPKTYDVFLDFENAAPTETEREIYDEVERVLRESEAVLDEIQVYKVNKRYVHFCFVVYFSFVLFVHQIKETLTPLIVYRCLHNFQHLTPHTHSL